MERFRGSLGALLGESWSPLGDLQDLGGLLGPSWALWLKKRGTLNSRRLLRGSEMQSWSSLGQFLERSWPLLGPSWAFLGSSWSSLGPYLGHLEASAAHMKRKDRMPKTLIFLMLLKDFSILESAVEGSKGAWIRLGAILEASWALLCTSWAPFGLVELPGALL